MGLAQTATEAPGSMGLAQAADGNYAQIDDEGLAQIADGNYAQTAGVGRALAQADAEGFGP